MNFLHPRTHCLCCSVRCTRNDPLGSQGDAHRERAYHVCNVTFDLGDGTFALCLHGLVRVGKFLFSHRRARHVGFRGLTLEVLKGPSDGSRTFSRGQRHTSPLSTGLLDHADGMDRLKRDRDGGRARGGQGERASLSGREGGEGGDRSHGL